MQEPQEPLLPDTAHHAEEAFFWLDSYTCASLSEEIFREGL